MKKYNLYQVLTNLWVMMVFLELSWIIVKMAAIGGTIVISYYSSPTVWTIGAALLYGLVKYTARLIQAMTGAFSLLYILKLIVWLSAGTGFKNQFGSVEITPWTMHDAFLMIALFIAWSAMVSLDRQYQVQRRQRVGLRLLERRLIRYLSQYSFA